MIHSIEPDELSVPEVHRLLLGGVAPRPIALVSTNSKNGLPNLSPFSFYNSFGANPPIVAFSAARKGRDASLKDTYNNLMDTKECVINAVTYSMVEQINIASAEFPPDVNEFKKSGLTPVKSDIVKPFRVKESPFQMECILRDMLSYGSAGASANIAVCEVIKFHYSEDIISGGIIHPDKIDLVGRMSADFYNRASGNAIFRIEKPINKNPIGLDSLPEYILLSDIYSKNELAKLANIEKLPSYEEAEDFINKFISFFDVLLETTPEAFIVYQHQNEYKKMLKTALYLTNNTNLNTEQFFQKTVKVAINNDDLNFAINVAVFFGKYLIRKKIEL